MTTTPPNQRRHKHHPPFPHPPLYSFSAIILSSLPSPQKNPAPVQLHHPPFSLTVTIFAHHSSPPSSSCIKGLDFSSLTGLSVTAHARYRWDGEQADAAVIGEGHVNELPESAWTCDGRREGGVGSSCSATVTLQVPSPIESEHASPPPPLSFLPLICACDLHLTSDRPLATKLLLIAATMTAVAAFMPLCRMQHVHLQA